MNNDEAVNLAKKYFYHAKKWEIAQKEKNKCEKYFHEGCMKMTLQIFEEFEGHNFGSPRQAIEEAAMKFDVEAIEIWEMFE